MSEFKVGDIVYIKGFNECGAIKVVHENFMDKIVRYEVKTNNNEYTLLGRMLEPIDINSQHTQNLEQRIEKLEKCVMGEQNTLEKCANVSSMNEFTKEEIEAFKHWENENYKWACKDEEGSIHIFKIKPVIYNIEELLKGESEE